MNSSKYDIFLRVAETGSLTAAAAASGCTQPNVSHAIAALEQEFGFRLVVRARGGAALTPEGEAILPYVRKAAAGMTAMQRAAEAIRSGGLQTIRIAAFSSVAVHWLPGILKTYRKLKPEMNFKLLNGDYHDVDAWLQNGEADVAFITLPGREDDLNIPLKEDRLMAVLPPDHPRAGQDKFPVSAFEGEDFITLLESSDRDSRGTLETAGVHANIRFTTKDDYAIIAMVADGLGTSIMPELLLTGQAHRVATAELDPPVSRTIALAIPAKNASGGTVTDFAEFVREWVRQNA